MGVTPIQTLTWSRAHQPRRPLLRKLREGPPACWWLDWQHMDRGPCGRPKRYEPAWGGRRRSHRWGPSGWLKPLGGLRGEQGKAVAWSDPLSPRPAPATGSEKADRVWKVHWLATMKPTMGDASKPVFRATVPGKLYYSAYSRSPHSAVSQPNHWVSA